VDVAILTAGLTKAYGSFLALDNLDLEIRAGEVFGYIGPKGRAGRPQNTGAESKRGTHSHTTLRSRPTSADVVPSPIRPMSSTARYPSRRRTGRNEGSASSTAAV